MISSTAPKAAARVLSDMANRLASSHASRTRHAKYARGAATWRPDRGARTPATKGKAGRQRMRGDIVTIAIMAAGTEGPEGHGFGGGNRHMLLPPAAGGLRPPSPLPSANGRTSSGAFAVRRYVLRRHRSTPPLRAHRRLTRCTPSLLFSPLSTCPPQPLTSTLQSSG